MTFIHLVSPAKFFLFYVLFQIGTASFAFAQMEHSKDSISLYKKQNRYDKALPFYPFWLDQVKKEKGEISPEYGSACNGFGDALSNLGINKEAEEWFLQGMNIRIMAMGEGHPEVARSCNNLGIFYADLGQFSKSESYYLRAIEIRTKALGEWDEKTGTSYNNLGNLYGDMGQMSKSETFLLKGLEIRKKALGEDHQDVGASYSNLGILYKNLGNYPKAIGVHEKALAIELKALGEENPSVAKTYSNIGIVYLHMEDYVKARFYQEKALTIEKKKLNPMSTAISRSYSNLGTICKEIGAYSRAIQFHQMALDIKRKLYGDDHPEVAASLNNLGNVYCRMGMAVRADSLFLKALDTQKRMLGEDHPLVGNSYHNLGKNALYHKDLINAEHWLQLSQKNHLQQIRRYMPSMSDTEKERFNEKIAEELDIFKAFAIERSKSKPAVSAELFNQQLATKALLLNSSAKWKHRIKSSGDKKLFAQYTQWEEKQNTLARLFQSKDSKERAGIDSLFAETEKLEKELSLRSESFSRLSERKQFSWKDIQATLKPGEAAIEVIRCQKFGVLKMVTDTSNPLHPNYHRKGLTDSIVYAALIVKPESKYPEIVLLTNGNRMEEKDLMYYKNSIRKKQTDENSYNKFWKPIGDKLGPGVKRIYFSAEGIYNFINLGTLYNPKKKLYLVDELDIHLLTLTKELILPKQEADENKLAYLFGFPDFNAIFPNQELLVNQANRRSPELDYSLSLEAVKVVVTDLPGTKTEVDQIEKLLNTYGWEVHSLTGEKALEENLKETYRPNLLHIATHGYFEKDKSEQANPLLRSGLLLAGAGRTINGQIFTQSEDGILTAYEAMNLNLDNTDLVVLSACETGLGEIKNGEGVYGLQRAFKVAGARSIVMSLWKVDDEATQELMVSFYKNWLGDDFRLRLSKPSPSAGKPFDNLRVTSKRSAFLAAQKELKAKYPNPYYWGAFVMVGE